MATESPVSSGAFSLKPGDIVVEQCYENLHVRLVEMGAEVTTSEAARILGTDRVTIAPLDDDRVYSYHFNLIEDFGYALEQDFDHVLDWICNQWSFKPKEIEAQVYLMRPK